MGSDPWEQKLLKVIERKDLKLFLVRLEGRLFLQDQKV